MKKDVPHILVTPSREMRPRLDAKPKKNKEALDIPSTKNSLLNIYSKNIKPLNKSKEDKIWNLLSRSLSQPKDLNAEDLDFSTLAGNSRRESLSSNLSSRRNSDKTLAGSSKPSNLSSRRNSDKTLVNSSKPSNLSSRRNSNEFSLTNLADLEDKFEKLKFNK
jgi:hypothetical protein